MRHVGSSLVLAFGLLAGCGKVSSFVDASDIDAFHVDAIPSGQVTVTTMTRRSSNNPGQPQADVDVFVIHADGTAGDSAQTDATGNATLDVVAGDSVTAIYLDLGDATLTTILVVAPGDHLTFGDQFRPPFDANSLRTMHVSWPVVAGATQYEVVYPCGPSYTSAPTLTMDIQSYNDCGISPMDLGFVATNVSGNVIGWGRLSDVAFVDTASTALTTWQIAGNMSVSATNIPSFVTDARLEADVNLNGGNQFSMQVSGAPSAGTVSGSFAFPGYGDSILGAGTFTRSGNFGPQLTGESLGPTTTTYSAEQTGLPWVSSVIASAAAHQVTWISDGDGTYDAAVVVMSWNRYPPDGGNESYQWVLIVPPGITQLDFPPLPAALARYAPDRNDSLNGANVILLDYGDDAGYAALRVHPEWEINPFAANGAPRLPVKLATDASFGNRPATPTQVIHAIWASH